MFSMSLSSLSMLSVETQLSPPQDAQSLSSWILPGGSGTGSNLSLGRTTLTLLLLGLFFHHDHH